jgi:hypothetical protein
LNELRVATNEHPEIPRVSIHTPRGVVSIRPDRKIPHIRPIRDELVPHQRRLSRWRVVDDHAQSFWRQEDPGTDDRLVVLLQYLPLA